MVLSGICMDRLLPLVSMLVIFAMQLRTNEISHMLVTGDKITCDFTSHMEQEISLKKIYDEGERKGGVQFLCVCVCVCVCVGGGGGVLPIVSCIWHSTDVRASTSGTQYSISVILCPRVQR